MTDNKNIKKGAPKHNPVCYQTLQDIVIPAGTILRKEAHKRDGYAELEIGHGNGLFSYLAVPMNNTIVKKVIA